MIDISFTYFHYCCVTICVSEVFSGQCGLRKWNGNNPLLICQNDKTLHLSLDVWSDMTPARSSVWVLGAPHWTGRTALLLQTQQEKVSLQSSGWVETMTAVTSPTWPVWWGLLVWGRKRTLSGGLGLLEGLVCGVWLVSVGLSHTDTAVWTLSLCRLEEHEQSIN